MFKSPDFSLNRQGWGNHENENVFPFKFGHIASASVQGVICSSILHWDEVKSAKVGILHHSLTEHTGNVLPSAVLE